MTVSSRITTSLVVLCGILLAGTADASAASFRDVPEGDTFHDAVEYLKAEGVLQGYEDGTFRPAQKVTRAEALKILVSAKKVSTGDLSRFPDSSFSDVPEGAWYRPYAEYALQKLRIIDGPPKTTTLNGAKAVKKAEFIKMALLTYGYQTTAYSEIKLPLSSDVKDVNAWYYPYMRLAFTTSVTMIGSDGTIRPERDLTRGDVALILHRLLLYRDGQRTQDLLSEAENEIVRVLQLLQKRDITNAEYASARALLAARGAHESMPDNGLVKGALKITESFRALVRGYRAALNSKFDDAIQLFKDAWTLAKRTEEISPNLKALAVQVQTLSSTMATDARNAKK